MTNNETNYYLKLIKSKTNKNITLAKSKRKILLEKQQGKCAECKKSLKDYFSKYVENPKTKEEKIICSNCAIKTPNKKI